QRENSPSFRGCENVSNCKLSDTRLTAQTPLILLGIPFATSFRVKCLRHCEMGVDNTGTLIPLVQQVWLNLAGTDVPPTHEAGFTVGPDFPDRCNDHPSDKSHIVSLVRGYFTAGNHAVEYIFGVF